MKYFSSYAPGKWLLLASVTHFWHKRWHQNIFCTIQRHILRNQIFYFTNSTEPFLPHPCLKQNFESKNRFWGDSGSWILVNISEPSRLESMILSEGMIIKGLTSILTLSWWGGGGPSSFAASERPLTFNFIEMLHSDFFYLSIY